MERVINWGCGICGARYSADYKGPCITCLENFKKRKAVDRMTPDERQREVIDLLTGPFTTVSIAIRAERLEELLGRKLKTYDEIWCGEACERCRQVLAEQAHARAAG